MAIFQYLDDYRLFDFFKEAKSITVYKNGKSQEFAHNNQTFEDIKGAFLELIYNAYEVPNFAFADDNEIKQNLANGYFIKFNFAESITYNDLPFSALLIKIEEDSHSLDIIKEQDDDFSGRFFCLNTDKNTTQLSNIIDKIDF